MLVEYRKEVLHKLVAVIYVLSIHGYSRHSKQLCNLQYIKEILEPPVDTSVNHQHRQQTKFHKCMQNLTKCMTYCMFVNFLLIGLYTARLSLPATKKVRILLNLNI